MHFAKNIAIFLKNILASDVIFQQRPFSRHRKNINNPESRRRAGEATGKKEEHRLRTSLSLPVRNSPIPSSHPLPHSLSLSRTRLTMNARHVPFPRARDVRKAVDETSGRFADDVADFPSRGATDAIYTRTLAYTGKVRARTSGQRRRQDEFRARSCRADERRRN